MFLIFIRTDEVDANTYAPLPGIFLPKLLVGAVTRTGKRARNRAETRGVLLGSNSVTAYALPFWEEIGLAGCFMEIPCYRAYRK